jgi:anthranilate phosphoribosyltransferase
MPETLTPAEITAVLKEIGRGPHSAKPIPRESARHVFGAMLDGGVPDLALGAMLLAWRIKGESVDELAGFLDAVTERNVPVTAPADRPLVVIPSYNGARHLPNLVPLLAKRVAEAGCAVLVHGVTDDPKRVTTRAVFEALGVAPAQDAAAITRDLAATGLAFVPIDVLCPGLARLLALRWKLGVRNSAHTVAKMLALPNAALRLVSVTHPEYLQAMHAFHAAHPANVLLFRGTEGEAIAHARRPQRMEWLHDGVAETVIEAVEGTITSLPALPEAIDAATTARWIEDALAGAVPVPPAITAQVDAIRRIVAAPAARHAA